MGGSEDNNFPPRMSQLQPPSTRVTTRVSGVSYSPQAKHSFPILIVLQEPGVGYIHGGSLGLWGRQLNYNTSNLQSAKRGFGILNRREQGGQRLGVKQPSRVTPENPSNGGQDNAGLYPTQSGGYRGKFLCPGSHHILQ